MITRNIDVKVSFDELASADLLHDWRDGSVGAATAFYGIVRNENHGRRVREMEYDGIPALAERILFEICGEAQEKIDRNMRFFVRHRLGKLKLGDVSVVILVASSHRHEAYEGSRYVIEELKRRIPVWKREFYEDGTDAWLRGCSHGPRHH